MRKAADSDLQAPSPWVVGLGTVGLFGFASFAFLGIAGANLSIALMLVAVAFDWRRFWRSLQGDPIVPLLAWATFAVALSAGLRASQFPEEWADQLRGLLEVVQLFFFLLVGWWLQGRQRLIFWVLTLALASVTVAIWRALDAHSLAELLALQRPHFLWSINAVGQYAASCLLGMALLTPRYWRWLADAPWRWPGRLAWLAGMGLVGALVVLSLSRGVWLSLLIVAGGLVLYTGWTHRHDRAAGRRLMLTALLGMTLLLGALSFSATIRERVEAIVQPVVQLWVLEGDVRGMSEESGRIRAQLLVLGMRSWLEAPWLGHGPRAPQKIIRDHREQFAAWQRYTDFHSLPVDFLASFGVLGSLPLLITFLLVLRVAQRGYAEGRLDRDLYLTLVSLLALGALAQMTDTRVLDSHGRFYSMLLAGAAYSWWLVLRPDTGGAARPSASR